MKNVCKFLAFGFLVLAVLLSFSLYDSSAFIFVPTFIALAIMLGVAYAIIDHIDTAIAVISRLANPKKAACLDLSFTFVIEAFKSVRDVKLIEGSGDINININGDYLITNVHFATFDYNKKYCEYKYNCVMSYIGGDIYDISSWKCNEINVYDVDNSKSVDLNED